LSEKEVTGDGEHCIMVSFMTLLLIKYCLSVLIKEDETLGACGTFGEEENWVQELARRS